MHRTGLRPHNQITRPGHLQLCPSQQLHCTTAPALHTQVQWAAWHHSGPDKRQVVARVAAPAAEAPSSASPTATAAAASVPVTPEMPLADIPLRAIINSDGYIMPEVAPGTQASVFAIFDQKQKLQYVGFSKELRSSLKTLLGRRPDKAFFYKSVEFSTLDQGGMIAVRDAWFQQCGGAPTGNKLAMERNLWQNAIDAGAISARGRRAAAEQKVAEVMAVLKMRGCVEEFVPDPMLLEEGKVDFQVGQAVDQQELDARRAAAAANQRLQRSASAIVDGHPKTFTISYNQKITTNGGFMMDVTVNFDHYETQHRVIVGKAYYEPYGIDPKLAIECAFSLLLQKKVERHTEGIIPSSTFPVNYFTVSEMEQWYGEEFGAVFHRLTGQDLRDGDGTYWRFNRLHDYGPAAEDVESWSKVLGPQDKEGYSW